MSLPQFAPDESLCISKESLALLLQNFDPKVPERGYLWTTDYRVELPVRVKKSGPGSEEPYTLCQMWERVLQTHARRSALNFEAKPGEWVTLTYAEYFERCMDFGKALMGWGLPEYTAVSLIGFNSPEWAYAFHGSIFARYLPIGNYTTNTPESCQYIANHSESSLVVVEDQAQLAKYVAIHPAIPTVRYFVISRDKMPAVLPPGLAGRVMLWADFVRAGLAKYHAASMDIEARKSRQRPGHCATFIYTSGTTGPPKAVMISHDNYTWITDRTLQTYPDLTAAEGRMVSMLPFSHVAAQLLDLVLCVRAGGSLFFCDASALQGNLVYFLRVARP